jgi:hypothetical protein
VPPWSGIAEPVARRGDTWAHVKRKVIKPHKHRREEKSGTNNNSGENKAINLGGGEKYEGGRLTFRFGGGGMVNRGAALETSMGRGAPRGGWGG